MHGVAILRATTRAAGRLVPAWVVTPRGFRMVAWINVVALWLILPSGGLVRLTSSGLGCPDWPLCHGGILPPASVHPEIEFTNRMLSGIVVVVAIIAWSLARQTPTASRGVRGLTLTAALMTLGQIPLGGITVLSGLNPVMVGSHFLLAMLSLAAAIMAALRYRDDLRGWTRTWDRRRGPFAGLAVLALLGVVITGILVTASGPHSGAATATDRLSNLQLTIWLHVRAVAVLVVVMLILGAWMWRERPQDPIALPVLGIFLPMLAIQVAIGEYQFRNGLPWQVVAVHVPVAGLVWSTGLILAWLVAAPPRPVSAQTARRPADRTSVPPVPAR